MNPPARWWFSVVAVVLGFCLVAGCSKESNAPVSTDDFSALPEAKGILESIDQKKYEDAVGALVKARESAVSDEQRSQYSQLMREVRERLSTAAATEPEAAQALELYRAAVLGR